MSGVLKSPTIIVFLLISPFTIQEEDITIINIYAPNIGAPQYVRQMLTSMKGEINNNTVIVGDFTTLFTPMDRSTKQKINKETQTLNDTVRPN